MKSLKQKFPFPKSNETIMRYQTTKGWYFIAYGNLLVEAVLPEKLEQVPSVLFILQGGAYSHGQS